MDRREPAVETDEPPTVSLRETVLPSDVDAVRSIVEATDFFRPDEVAVAVELVEERFSRGPASEYFFVFAEADGAVVGYTCYGPIACTTTSYDLYWIAVDPRYQLHGIGRTLLTATESKIAEAGGTRVYVDTSGQPKYASTRAFYERNSFRCDARLRDFYAPGDDRVIYVKEICHR